MWEISNINDWWLRKNEKNLLNSSKNFQKMGNGLKIVGMVWKWPYPWKVVTVTCTEKTEREYAIHVFRIGYIRMNKTTNCVKARATSTANWSSNAPSALCLPALLLAIICTLCNTQCVQCRLTTWRNFLVEISA